MAVNTPNEQFHGEAPAHAEYRDLRGQIDDFSKRKYPDAVLTEFKQEHPTEYKVLQNDLNSPAFRASLQLLDQTLDVHLADRMMVKLSQLGYDNALWQKFLSDCAKDGLPDRSAYEFLDTSDDKFQAKKVLAMGRSLAEFQRVLSGSYSFYKDQAEWITMAAPRYAKANRLASVTGALSRAKGASDMAKTVSVVEAPQHEVKVKLRDKAETSFPDPMTTEEGLKRGLLIRVDGKIQPSMGLSWAHPDSKNNWAVVPDTQAELVPETDFEPAVVSGKSEPASDAGSGRRAEVASREKEAEPQSQAEFMDRLNKPDQHYLKITDKPGTTAHLEFTVTKPGEVENSRAWQVVGAGSKYGLVDPQNYTLKVGGVDYHWGHSPDDEGHETWVNKTDGTGARLRLRRGTTSMDLVRNSMPVREPVASTQRVEFIPGQVLPVDDKSPVAMQMQVAAKVAPLTVDAEIKEEVKFHPDAKLDADERVVVAMKAQKLKKQIDALSQNLDKAKKDPKMPADRLKFMEQVSRKRLQEMNLELVAHLDTIDRGLQTDQALALKEKYKLNDARAAALAYLGSVETIG